MKIAGVFYYLFVMRAFAELDTIAERINHSQNPTPWLIFYTGAQKTVFTTADFLMQGIDTLHAHENIGAGAAIAMMFAEVQHQIAARNLHIERHILSKAMFPVTLKTQIVEIKFSGFLNVENSEYRANLLKLDIAHKMFSGVFSRDYKICL